MSDHQETIVSSPPSGTASENRPSLPVEHPTSSPKLPNISDIGITTLWPLQDDSAVEADICFVHGLGGNPRTTWQYGTSDAEFQKKNAFSRTMRRLNCFSKSHEMNDSVESKEMTKASCFWPYDLLPKDFDNIRVLTYGYDSKPAHWYYKHKATQMTIDQHTQTMLQRISDRRAHCPTRPIIFVAHSLGGILVTNMILEPRKYHQLDGNKMLYNIYGSCRAIIFFGTPHVGAGSAEIANMVGNVVRLLPLGPTVYKGILRDLKPYSQKLVSIMRDFNDILTNVPTAKRIQIFSFQEGKGYSRINMFDDKVVPDGSSIFNISRSIERSSFIPKNHMNMCRFRSERESGYVDFKAALNEYLTSIAKQEEENKQRTEARKDQDGITQDVLESLDFQERVVRMHQLRDIRAKKESFNWIWTSELKSWLESTEPLFWISGKPASGKSTLMYHLSTNREVSEILGSSMNKNWVIMYHFFDFRAGVGLRNNLTGFVQSLVLQLCSRFQECRTAIINQFETSNLGFKARNWSKTDLQSALEIARNVLRCQVLLLVDGLDELEGTQSDKFELCAMLKQMSLRTKVCVASRPDPPYWDAFHDVPNVQMDRLNGPGILSFVSDTLVEFWGPNHTDHTYQELSGIAQEIKVRAKGVFLWARFAVTEVLDSQTKSETPEDLQKRLSLVPDDLKSIYARILRKLTSADKATTSRVLLLLLCAKETFSLGQTCIALSMVTSLEQGNCSHPLALPELSSYKSFRKRILASAGGILETSGMGRGQSDKDVPYTKLQIVHRTVESYLQQGGWKDLNADEAHIFQPHYLMIRICARTLQEKRAELHSVIPDEAYQGSPRNPSLKESESLLNRDTESSASRCQRRIFSRHRNEKVGPLYELLAYALLFLPEHARDFEEETGTSSYKILYDVLSDVYVDVHQRAWEDNTCQCCNRWHWGGYNGRVDSVLKLAIIHGMTRFVEESLTPENSKGQKHLEKQVISGPQRSLIGIPWRSTVEKSKAHNFGVLTAVAIDAASHLDRTDILRVCLAYDPFVEDKLFRCALMEAPIQVIQILMEDGKTRSGQLVFQSSIDFQATWMEDEQLKTPFRFRPLWDIAKRSDQPDNEDLIDLFLKRGEKINGQCGPGGTVVHSFFKRITYAFRDDNLTVLESLLRKGADINSVGPYGTPLEYFWMLVEESLGKHSQKQKWRLRNAISNLVERGAVVRRNDRESVWFNTEEMRLWKSERFRLLT